MESFRAMPERTRKGAFGKKRLHRYLKEFAGWHNLRSRDTIRQMESVFRGMVGKRLVRQDLIARTPAEATL